MLSLPGILFALAAVADNGFVTTNGRQLELNGEPFAFMGANSYSMTYSREHAELQFLTAKQLGLNVIRLWGFWDGDYQGEPGKRRPGADRFGQFVLQSGPGVYEEEGLRKLDYVLYRANVHGIKLIIPLMNEWGEFGGIVQYLRWAGVQVPEPPGHNVGTGEPCLEDAADLEYVPQTEWFNCYEADVKNFRGLFWECEECHEIYRAWVTMLLNRVNVYTGVAYKDDPAVMIWEVMNEPRYGPWLDQAPLAGNPEHPGVEAGGQLVTDFLVMASELIQEIDENHLVSHGGEGLIADQFEDREDLEGLKFGRRQLYPWYQGYGEGVDFRRNAEIESIDVLSIHAWPFNWSIAQGYASDGIESFMPEWLEAHVDMLDAWGIEKPLYMGEFGWQILRVPGSGSDVPDRDRVYSAVFQKAVELQIPGLAYWDMVARSTVDFATYTGEMQRSGLQLQSGVFETDDIAPHDLDFNFDVYCPEDETTCKLISDYAATVNAMVEAPDPPWVDPCDDGQSLCGGDCVDLQTDTDNCGRCAESCEDDQTCFRGWCIQPPEERDDAASGESSESGGNPGQADVTTGCTVAPHPSRSGLGWMFMMMIGLRLGTASRRQRRDGGLR